MSLVETIRGPVDVGHLGQTLMHEHVFILTPDLQQDFPDIMGWDEDERVADAVRRLRELKARGIDTIVDLTVLGMGRYLPRLTQINEQVDINIIAATGFYTMDLLPNWLNLWGTGGLMPDREPLTEIFIRDITEGIAGTGVRAAVLKCVTDKPGVTPTVDRILRAVAQAHRVTGAPISTHTDAALRRGLEQQDVFESEGVDLSRVVIGHSGDSNDLDYLNELMARGSFIGMDRFGLDEGVFPTFPERVRVVSDLCEQGHADQMVLSHDAACWMDWLPDNFHDLVAPIDMTNWHFNHISDHVLPALRESGVTETQIKTMLVDNPRKVFSSSTPY